MRGIANRGVAQPGSATALGAVGREFESLHPDQFNRRPVRRPPKPVRSNLSDPWIRSPRREEVDGRMSLPVRIFPRVRRDFCGTAGQEAERLVGYVTEDAFFSEDFCASAMRRRTQDRSVYKHTRGSEYVADAAIA